MLEILGSAVTALLGGGATGLLGSIGTAVIEHKNLKLKLDHKERMARVETDQMRLEGEYAVKVAETEAEGQARVAASEAEAARAVAEGKALEASYEHDKASYGIRWIDAIRGLVRPVMTLYLSAVVTMIYLDIEGAIAEQDLGPALVENVILGVLYVWATVTLWWFGSRIKDRAVEAVWRG